ncbi:hypothetical protein DRQ07_01615 [candidate division KSB1 bacterium]|nr:MAG: hypothetical protein DRQ07_01615 [candidate division KSB1 bacterium]
MRKNKPFCFVITYSFLFISQILLSQTLDFQGQFSTSLLYSRNNYSYFHSNVRYVPQSVLSLERGTSVIDVLLSFNLNSSYGKNFQSENFQSDINMELYRFTARLSSDRYEARIGLQRINFGPGQLLRPLMWFERLDPRDPLQMTKGVYSALIKYYFRNDINIWIWSLFGNKTTKGWEIFKSNERKPEAGGRVEFPLSRGEFGISVHHRQVKVDESMKRQIPGVKNDFAENKLGLDLRLDFKFGFWSELCFINKDLPNTMFLSQKMYMAGIDYTFSIGNGLYTAGEYFYQSLGTKISENLYPVKLLACTINYPIDMINSLSVIFFRDSETRDWYRFLQWKITYDKFRFFIMGFINSGYLPVGNSAYQAFSGKGIEIMFLYNH